MAPDHRAADARELERLLSELVDGEDSTEVIAQLGKLLEDNPSLQQDYVRYVSLHSCLEGECNTLGISLKSLVESQFALDSSQPQPDRDSVPIDVSIEPSAREFRRPGVSPFQPLTALRFRSLGRFPTTMAASLMMGTFLVAGALGSAITAYSIERGWWWGFGSRYTASEVAAAEQWLEDKKKVHGDPLGRFPIADQGAWAGIQPSSPIDATAEIDEDIQGPINVEPFNGVAGRGYLLPLQPGHGLELFVDVESFKENALVVKELSADGRITGRNVTFNNQDVGRRLPSSWRVGQIGYWVDFNEHDTVRYYLICGVHKERNRENKKAWYFSDFEPLLAGRKLLYLGWDDAPVAGTPTERDPGFAYDRDFNDVSAIVRIRYPDDLSAGQMSRVVAMPEVDGTSKLEGAPSHSARFSVNPGDSVIIHVSSAADDQNALSVVDQKTMRVWWKSDNIGKGGPKLNLYSIDNRTDSPQEFMLVAHRLSPVQEGPRGDLEELAHHVHIRDDDYWEIGFEGLPTSDTSRFDDLRVRMHWIH